MKFIDDKGRLFGTINVFDLFLLCAVAGAALFVYKWITISKDPSWADFEYIHAKCKVSSIVPGYVADSFKEGDFMVNEKGDVVARVDKILSNEPYPGVNQEFYVSKNGDKIYLNRNTVVISSKEGETVYSRPVTAFERRHSSREIIFILDILGYRKKGVVHSCINNLQLQLGYSFSFNTARYSITVSFIEVLI